MTISMSAIQSQNALIIIKIHRDTAPTPPTINNYNIIVRKSKRKTLITNVVWLLFVAHFFFFSILVSVVFQYYSLHKIHLCQWISNVFLSGHAKQLLSCWFKARTWRNLIKILQQYDIKNNCYLALLH